MKSKDEQVENKRLFFQGEYEMCHIVYIYSKEAYEVKECFVL
jgi:hypothetical protein